VLHAGIYTEKQINALYRMQMKVASFTHQTQYSELETVAKRRTIERLCALFKAYSGERVLKAKRDRMRWPHYLNRVEHCRKIRDGK
jgi:hypothetical protein